MEKDTLLYKIVLIGGNNVDKLNFMKKAANSNQDNPTIGTNIVYTKVTIDKKTVIVGIADTANQERFLLSYITGYLRGAHGIFIIYDITDKDSFDFAKTSINASKNSRPKMSQISLIGNKFNGEDKRIISEKEGNKLALDNGFMFKEVDTNTGSGIEIAFLEMIKKIMKNNNQNHKIKKYSGCHYL